MPGKILHHAQFAEKIVGKAVENSLDHLATVTDVRKKVLKAINQKAARKRAKNLDLNPVEQAEIKFKKELNEKIIQEVKKRRLTHQQVANISLASRPNITRIMNRNLKKVSVDFLVRILSILGVRIKVSFWT